MEKVSVANAIDRHLCSNTDYTRLIEKPAFDVGFYRPIRFDKQTPHARDELYIIAEGTGKFHCGNEITDFAEGDLFFVPAGVEHSFSDFSYDFATWVIFFAMGSDVSAGRMRSKRGQSRGGQQEVSSAVRTIRSGHNTPRYQKNKRKD